MIMRRQLLITAIVLLLSAGASAQAQEWMNKLDGHALMLISAQEAGRAHEVAQALGDLIDVPPSPRDGPLVGVLVRLKDASEAHALEAAGMRIETLAGDVAVGSIPVRLLSTLAQRPETVSISISQMLVPLNDLAIAAVNADAVHQGAGLPAPYRGQGVVVGVLDTGIDFTHPDFQDDAGSRIEYLLEYQPDPVNSPPVAEQSWTKQVIDTAPQTVTQRDIHGHGTHVTGTAAGGGRGAPFPGAAPESRLVIVKGSRTGSDPTRPHTFSERDMINGTAWIFSRADDLNMPAVVNLSIGSPGGPLDGSLDINRAMSNLTAPGRLIVFAAGNNGVHVIHAGAAVPAGTSRTVAFNYSEASNAFVSPQLGQLIQVTGWYDPGTITSVQVAARNPQTGAIVAETSLPTGQGHSDLVPLNSGSATVGLVQILAQTVNHPNNNLGAFTVLVANNFDTAVNLRDHLWTITIQTASQGRFDAWIATPTMGAFATSVPNVGILIPGDNQFTLNRLAAAENVLTAGSFTTRREWQDANGTPITATFGGEPLPLGERTYFSSFGPTRDGRIRPDVMAPGSWLISSRSADAPPNVSLTPFQSPRYALSQGTSMAAPVLTGSVALMLQLDPTLTTTRARDILHETALADSQTGSVPNVAYGFGKLDAFGAVQLIAQLIGGGLDGELALHSPFPNPMRGSSTIVFTLAESRDVRLSIYDILGREIVRLADERLRPGPHRYTFDRRGLASGVYVVSLSSEREHVTRRMVIVN